MLAVATSVMFTLLLTRMRAWVRTGWWTLLPIAFWYTSVLRTFVLGVSIGGIPSIYNPYLQAANLPFWIMAFVFAYGLFFTVLNQMTNQGPRGITGATGANGATGETGARGKPGVDGIDGHDGHDGKRG
jgi:hypothetical protein